MKIIKVGKIPNSEEVRSTCQICKTVFEWVPRIEGKLVFDPREGNFYLVECPYCGKEHARAVSTQPTYR